LDEPSSNCTISLEAKHEEEEEEEAGAEEGAAVGADV